MRPAAAETNSWRKNGMQSRAAWPTSSAATGTSRQPRTVQALLARRWPRSGPRPAARSVSSLRQEGGAHGIRAGHGEVEVHDLAEEGVRDLGEDAGAVADQRVGAGGAAVLEVAQRGEGVVDDVVTRASPHRGHEGDTAGVVLVLTAVQPRVGGLGGEARRSHVRVTVLGGSQVRCGTQVGHTRSRAWTALATASGRIAASAVCPAM